MDTLISKEHAIALSPDPPDDRSVYPACSGIIFSCLPMDPFQRNGSIGNSWDTQVTLFISKGRYLINLLGLNDWTDVRFAALSSLFEGGANIAI